MGRTEKKPAEGGRAAGRVDRRATPTASSTTAGGAVRPPPDGGSPDDDRIAFGQRLRNARKKLGWTLAEVAERSAVSITTISRVERGQLALSYEKFAALARALGMDIGSMFAARGTRSVALERPVLTRAGQGTLYRGTAFTYEFLGAGVTGKQMSPIVGTVHARRIEGPEAFARHDGEEFVYVLSGTIEVHFEDGETVRLSRGDSLYYDSRIGHAFVSVGRTTARVIGATTRAPGRAP